MTSQLNELLFLYSNINGKDEFIKSYNIHLSHSASPLQFGLALGHGAKHHFPHPEQVVSLVGDHH